MTGIIFEHTVLLSLIQAIWCDYSCVCNYNVEKSVYPTKSQQVAPIGYMYEFDCKGQIGSDNGDWISIAFEHQVGYLHKDDQTLIQTCPGSPPIDDLVTTTTVPSTTPITSTSTDMPRTSPIIGSTSPSIYSTHSTGTKPPTTIITTATKTILPTNKTQSTTKQYTSPLATVTVPSAIPTSSIHSMLVSSTTSAPVSTSVTVAQNLTITPSTKAILPTTTNVPSRISSPTTSSVSSPPTNTRFSCNDLLKDMTTQDNGTLFAYGEECFELVRGHKSWVDAELECRRKGGHLIDIADSNEQRVVYQVVNTYYHYSVWIGLHDIHKEENFEWTSGKAVVYTNWYPGRKDPDRHGEEDCVAMGMDKYTGRWEDRPCAEMRGFVCQFGKQFIHPPAFIG